MGASPPATICDTRLSEAEYVLPFQPEYSRKENADSKESE